MLAEEKVIEILNNFYERMRGSKSLYVKQGTFEDVQKKCMLTKKCEKYNWIIH